MGKTKLLIDGNKDDGYCLVGTETTVTVWWGKKLRLLIGGDEDYDGYCSVAVHRQWLLIVGCAQTTVAD